MDKMLFQFTRIGFCDDIHTKQRRANIFEPIQFGSLRFIWGGHVHKVSTLQYTLPKWLVVEDGRILEAWASTTQNL
jgi:hypothetical protein